MGKVHVCSISGKSMPNSTSEDVIDWWRSYINRIRDRDGTLFHGIQDFDSPCQVEVFWISEPLEGQAAIVTHDRDRPDEEIIINGPYQGEEFVDQVATVSEQDRWQQSVPPQIYDTPPGQHPSRADILASIISTLIDRLEQSIFNDFSSSEIMFLNGSQLWGNSSYHLLIGNVTDLDLPGEGTSEGATSESDTSEDGETGSEENPNTESEREEEIRPAGGGFIYPAVWVESAPERSFADKVWGSHFRENEIVYRDEILGDEFIAFRDGLLAILDDDGDRTIDLLNTFFGIGMIGPHFQWRSLQPREFISGRVGPDGFKSGRAELSTPSGRNQLWAGESGPSDDERGLIQSEVIEYLLKVAEVIYPISDLRERVMLHLQAHTHFSDDEYTASFLLNWNIIEQHIENILDRELRDEYGVNRDRRETIQGHNWFISHRIELAEITDTIDDNIYSELDRHRKKRNKVVHDMETVSGERAEDIDHFVSELLCREINRHLESTDTEPLVHRPVPMKPSTRRGDYNPIKWE